MLPRKYRLTKDKDFKRVNSLGRPFFSSKLKIKITPNKLEVSRFAVVTSARLSKKAVVRNRVRRQLSEVLRLNKDKIITGRDIVVWVKPPALDSAYQELEREFMYLMSKAKLLS